MSTLDHLAVTFLRSLWVVFPLVLPTSPESLLSVEPRRHHSSQGAQSWFWSESWLPSGPLGEDSFLNLGKHFLVFPAQASVRPGLFWSWLRSSGLTSSFSILLHLRGEAVVRECGDTSEPLVLQPMMVSETQPPAVNQGSTVQNPALGLSRCYLFTYYLCVLYK